MKKSTIITIAAELSISPSTVSRAFDPDSRISDTMRKRILATADKHGYTPNRAAARLSKKEVRIGILLNKTYVPGINELLRGIRDGYRSLYDYKLSLDIKFFENSCQSGDDFHRILETFNKPDGMIFSGYTSSEAIEQLSKYAELNKNLVLLQSDISDIRRLFISMHDPEASAEIAAEFLFCCLKMTERRKIALFTGNREIELHPRAAAAFEKKCKELGLELIASYDTKDSEELLAEQTNILFKNNPPDGIYITTGESLSLCRFLETQEKRPALVTFDTYPELNVYLKKGIISATVYQNMYQQAYSAFTQLVCYIVEKITVPEVISPIPVLILPGTLRYYTPPYDDMDLIDHFTL